MYPSNIKHLFKISKFCLVNVIRESHYKMQLCTHFHILHTFDDTTHLRNWNKTPFIHKMQN